MRWSIAAAMVAISSGPAFAITCPEGAYPWIGHRGVEYCRQDFIGPREPSAPGLRVCPADKQLRVDAWGRQTCTPLKSARRADGVRR